jgi:nitrogen regulatory protein PII
LALDTVDDVFGRASPTDIQETIDRCELELRAIKKTAEKTADVYLSTRRNPFTSEFAGKVIMEIVAQTEKKRTVIDKLKGLLGRGRSLHDA